MTNGNGEGSVSYTVKELIAMLEKSIADQLAKILRQLEELDNKLDTKASSLRVDGIENKLSDFEKRIIHLELSNAGRLAVAKINKWYIGIAVIVVAAALTPLIYLASGH